MLEFAIVAAPFLFTLFAIIEISLIFVVNTSLRNATMQLARQVKVGSIVFPGKAATAATGNQMILSTFKTTVCGGIPILPQATCLSQLQVDVRKQSAFLGQTSPNPISGTNFNSTNFCFYSAGPGDIVTVHVYFLWSVSTPMLFNALAQVQSQTTPNGTTTGNFFVLSANEVFKNEPNATTSNTGGGC